MEVNRYNMFINSSLRTSGTNTYFQIILKNPLRLTHPDHYFTVGCGSVCIPFSFKMINNSNNVIPNCRLEYGGNVKIFSMTITAGNYTITQLLDYITKYVKKELDSWTTNTVQVNAEYDVNSGFVTFSVKNDSATITLNTQNTFIGKMLGFSGNITFSETSFATSVNHINVSPVKSLLVRSDSLRQAQSYESLVEKDVISDIICRIPITTQFNSYINYENSNLISTLSNNIVDVISLYLTTDQSYDLVNLGGLEWQIELNFYEMKPVESPSNIEPAQAQSGYAGAQNVVTPMTNVDNTVPSPFGLYGVRMNENLLEKRQELLQKLEVMKQQLQNLLKAKNEVLPTISSQE